VIRKPFKKKIFLNFKYKEDDNLVVGNATALQLQPIFEKENNKPFH